MKEKGKRVNFRDDFEEREEGKRRREIGGGGKGLMTLFSGLQLCMGSHNRARFG